MSLTLSKIKKDFQQLVEVDKLQKTISILEKDNLHLQEEVRALRKEVMGLAKKVDSMGPGGKKLKSKPLIDVIEEIMQDSKEPMKVVELRNILLKDRRVRSKADNFYAVIATAMNNSDKFDKVGPGVYEYKG